MRRSQRVRISGRSTISAAIALMVALTWSLGTLADDEPHAVERDYHTAPPSPQSQSASDVTAKSSGCMSCHERTDRTSMHASPAVKLGCTDCHGGDASVALANGTAKGTAAYASALEHAHVLPRFPSAWPSSANPQRTYTLLNKESPEFVRFVNPSDYRVAKEACGACHLEIIEASVRSMHSTGVMLWGGAAYNNGILPFKRYILGESYDRNGVGTTLYGPKIPDAQKQAAENAGVLPVLHPLPTWETIEAGGCVPRIRARRAQHRQPVRGDRPAGRARPVATHRGTRPARLSSIESRAWHGCAHRGACHQHHEDAFERSVHVVSRHQ